ncbi:WD40 repeat-like protein [Choiromyces venosus 120613-1]|uniref:Mitochondrial division protein 1 n=1 Tax=Choiromyces venosus 120613-1 TaxID=1336337 RepID=A0A3N4K7C1_9PEZI|nr:WD40 repeat-like protein [Choiromyces venosus 120613-1]
MRWVFTGGSDGYIRRFDWFGSINGKVPLTVAQRHPFVDSVTRAGVLLSYWENEEPIVAGKPQVLHVPETTDDLKLSPVYSLAVQNQSLWLLSGLESGGINLQSVRHDEGKIITTLRKHNSAVSVLTLANDEKSVLSGSWDGIVYDWDLNTGQARREFPSSSGQISSVAFRPISTEWQDIRNTALINGVSGGRDKGLSNGVGAGDGDGDEDAPGSPAESTGSFDSLFGDNGDMGMGGEEDEMSRAITNGLGSDSASLENGREDQKTSNGDTIMTDDVTRIHTNETSGTRSGSTNGGLETNGFLPATSTNDPPSSTDQNVFLASSMDGTLRIWDIREPNPVAVSMPSKGVPPWCMNSCWSTNGNFIYAGRRNGTVEEFSVQKGIGETTRTMKFPLGSGPVSALTALPNGRHLICASFDNLRLYDLSENASKHSTVPFYIIPGHHGGVISSLYVDATGQYLISIAGNRGWEGVTTEVLLGYEIVSVLS